MPLRIALFGQAPVGSQCLDRLREAGHEVVGVFAPPDSGRPDPLAQRALELGLPLVRRRFYQRKTGEPIAQAVAEHAALGADLNLLASFTSFLPRAIADAPRYRSVCFHPSLLPRYRGGAALQWQIIEGERETGVSIFVPDDGVDTGPLVVQRGGVEIGPHDTAGTLFFSKLAPLGVEALIESANQIADGTAIAKPQDETRATHQGLVDDAVAALDLRAAAEQIDRRVRGCDPQPGAFLRWAGAPVRLFDARLEAGSPGAAAPGELLEVGPQGLLIALRGGLLRVARVRADAGKEPAAQFAERRELKPG